MRSLKVHWKPVSVALLAVAGLAAGLYLQSAGIASAGDAKQPMVMKSTIVLTANRETIYKDPPKKDKSNANWNVYQWTPRIGFSVLGPIAPGSQLYVDFTMGGKKLISYDCDTGEIDETQWYSTTCGASSSDWEGKGKSTTKTGEIAFEIKMRNELESWDRSLLKGTAEVKMFNLGPEMNCKGCNTYYFDYDWALPIGYAGFNDEIGGQTILEDQCDSLEVEMWFQQDVEGDAIAYLYYKGKVVGSTTPHNQDGPTWGMSDTLKETWIPEGTGHKWYFTRFSFTSILQCVGKNAKDFDPKTNDGDRVWYPLFKNPGEYEVKVLLKGKLIRTAKLTIDDKGYIVDSGIAAKNWLGTWKTVIPVKVVAAETGSWDKEAWKKAFFGNPLSDFTAP